MIKRISAAVARRSSTAEPDWPSEVAAGRRVWFDFFDTLVTRPVVDPSDVFFAVEWALRDRGLLAVGGDFVKARLASERELRDGLVSGEVRLTDIYGLLAKHLAWSPAEAVAAAAIEKEMETQLTVALPALRGVFEQGDEPHGSGLTGNRTRLILSDTYLEASALRQILGRHVGAVADTVQLLTSADEQRTKRSGDLFSYALRTANVDAADITFVGDHPVSDVIVPRRAGMRVAPVESPEARDWEYTPGDKGEGDRFRRVCGGSARAVRAGIAPEDPGSHEVLVGHAAIGLTGFVGWVLQQAQRTGSDTVWFLGRDGQILHRLATPIAGLIAPDCTVAYLHASRLAWCLPAWSDLDEAFDQWLGRYARAAAVEDIASALGCSSSLAAYVHTRASRRIASPSLGTPASLRREFQRLAEGARANLHAYLGERGVLDAARPMLVDVGWNGTLQAALARNLQIWQRGVELRGAYLRLVSRPHGLGREALLEFAPADRQMNATVIEYLTRADHGSVRAFRRSGNGTHPVFEAFPPSEGDDVRALQEPMVRYAEHLALWMGSPGFPRERFLAWYQGFAVARLRDLSRQPSQRAGHFFAGRELDDGPRHARRASLARIEGRGRLLRSVIADVTGSRPSAWIEGTIAASTSGRSEFRLFFAVHRALLRLRGVVRPS